MSENVIEFKDFTFKYDAQAEPTLYNINLKIKKGEKVLICGPSGCGKSTLSHCLNGLIPASYPGDASGELLIADKSYKEHTIFSLSKITGTVLQDSDGQFIGLTVGEDIAFALENENTPLSVMKQKVLEAAKKVGIESFLAHAPHELSGGQKQRVSLAGVMVDNVSLFLFDEPLANLDPAAGKNTIELIEQIHKTTDSAIVIIEHRLEDVLYKSVDRVILMSEGRIIADMTPDELLSSNLLIENGIREPLYSTALKYAGVNINPDMKPGRIDTLILSDEDKDKIRAWYKNVEVEKKELNSNVVLTAQDISFSYDGKKEALSNVSLKIRKGEMVSIVGRNGAGKSTFSKLVCGFEKPSKGRFLLEDKDLAEFSIKERADHIGYVMQNPNQMISKTMIFDEVALGLRTRGVPEEEVTPRVEETLKICGLWPFRKWPVSALSFGQNKRVTIASLLVLEPEMIILDEPTAGQDYRHYTDIMTFLEELNGRGITVVMITHDMHLMLEYARRAVVFSQGRVIADDSSASILTNPDVISRANLKETSLYELALRCGIGDARAFVQRFIDYEREVCRK